MAVAFLALAPIWIVRGSVTGDSGLLGLPTESTTSLTRDEDLCESVGFHEW